MKKFYLTILIFIVILLPLCSAEFSDFFGKLTGKVTSQPVNLQIQVGGGNPPTIITHNETITDISSGLNEGPLTTQVTIKFEASDTEGAGNLDSTKSEITFSKSGEQSRFATCTEVAGEDTLSSKNYTCTVDMYWWDAPGIWTITSHAEDLNGNIAEDNSKTFIVGATTGFVAAPASLTWNEINPGATNIPANEFITLNNTGNLARNIEINSTHLLGLSDNTKGLYAEDFAVDISTGCGGTSMQHFSFTQISAANLPRGDYTLADGSGQEELYFCLNSAGSDLTQQGYSTAEEGAWVMKITS